MVLLRLQEKDIVRLCGLAAAGQGLELAARHLVTQCERQGARLEALVAHVSTASLAWLELTEHPMPAAMRWGCALDAPAGAPPGSFGCLHVAAILSAWVRHPEDFATPERELSPSVASAVLGPPDRVAAGPASSASMPLVESVVRRALLGRSLADELRRVPASELLRMAERVLGESVGQEGPARERLAAALGDPVLLAALVARLDPGAVRLLWATVLLGGAITAGDLDAQARRSGRPVSVLRAEARALERHALAFRAASGAEARGLHQWRDLAGWRVPREIRAGLALALPIEPLPSTRAEGPPVLPDASAPAAGHTARKGNVLRLAPAEPRTMARTLAVLARAPFPLGPLAPPPRDPSPARRGGGPENSVAMVVGDMPPERLAELARGARLPAGLLRVARRVLLWAREREPDHPLLNLPAIVPTAGAEALRAGFHLWLEAPSPAELADLDLAPGGVRARYDLAHPAFRPSALASECAEARALVTRLVAMARPGVWYPVDGLLDLLWVVHPHLLRGRQRAHLSPAWWLEAPHGRVLRPSIHEEWLAAEGLYLTQLLCGPLHWWGVVDLAVDAAERLLAFRVSRFGTFLLGASAPDEAAARALESENAPAVLPTRGGALAVDPLAAGTTVLNALEQWARPTAVAGGRLIYTPAADLAASAFDRAGSPDALLDHLRTFGGVGGTRAAAALAARLDAWRSRYGGTSIAEGLTLLEAANDAALVEALAALPEIDARAHRLGPSAVLLAPEDAAELRAALKKRGYAV